MCVCVCVCVCVWRCCLLLSAAFSRLVFVRLRLRSTLVRIIVGMRGEDQTEEGETGEAGRRVVLQVFAGRSTLD